MMRVLVTCPPMLKNMARFLPIFEEHGVEPVIPPMVQVLTENELLDIVPTVDGWIIGDDPATEKVFAAGKAGRLRAAVKWGVGVDNVDFAAAKKLGVPVTNTPRMFGNEVAELAVAYMIGLARQTHYIDRQIRIGNWAKPTGVTLHGKCAAIIGLGDIGNSTAKRLRAFGMKLLGYDPRASLRTQELFVDELLNFPDRLQEADFLILACSLNESTHHIINARTIPLLKDGAFLINVSRGALVDEESLVAALSSGKIAGAAMDVFETEPLPQDSPLRNFDQCIFSSHNGSNAVEAVLRASHRAIELLFEYLNAR
jgi:D-3-phosphoglycerate dehydrogenase